MYVNMPYIEHLGIVDGKKPEKSLKVGSLSLSNGLFGGVVHPSWRRISSISGNMCVFFHCSILLTIPTEKCSVE